MRRLRQELRWWGLSALIPLTVVLIMLDVNAAMTETGHMILLAGVVVLICTLALRWVERHPGLEERDGADALNLRRPLASAAARERPQHSDPEPPSAAEREPAAAGGGAPSARARRSVRPAEAECVR